MMNWSQTMEHLLNTIRYEVIQSNGQRIFAPSSQSGIAPPPKGTEIFVGNLPHDLYEDEIIPLFSQVGPIYNSRMMLDFFGRNRGYAFLSYFLPEHAHAAIRKFNDYTIRNRTQIAVCISVDNRRLFIGNVPRNRNVDEIRAVLERYVEGVINMILYQEPHNKECNRGFVFVEFGSHREAAIARRQLSPGNLVLWGNTIFVDWAEPLPIVHPEVLNRVTKLYLSNLPIEMSADCLRKVLSDVLADHTSSILKVHKITNYAFVHFTVRTVAEHAYNKLKGLMILDNIIEVEWARPLEYSKRYRYENHPQNFCKSVPPNLRKLVHQSIALRQVNKKDKKNPPYKFQTYLESQLESLHF